MQDLEGRKGMSLIRGLAPTISTHKQGYGGIRVQKLYRSPALSPKSHMWEGKRHKVSTLLTETFWFPDHHRERIILGLVDLQKQPRQQHSSNPVLVCKVFLEAQPRFCAPNRLKHLYQLEEFKLQLQYSLQLTTFFPEWSFWNTKIQIQ